jgi:hypothetical protein
MRAQWHYGLIAVVLVCAVTPLAAAANIAGSYSCRGANPDGSAYTGTVEISANGEGYTLRWSIGGHGHTGTGILSEGQLSASWGTTGGDFGIVVYKVEEDGRLVGKWLSPGGGKLGTETLTP